MPQLKDVKQQEILVRVKGLGMLRVNPPSVEGLQAKVDRDALKKSLDEKFKEVRGFVSTVYNGLDDTDKAALWTAPIPILGDAVGIVADMKHYIQDPESRTIVNGLITLMSAVPLVPAVSQADNILEKANKVKKNINAWHGSPHRFDKFDISKIGTGEGAQAYGRGLYFSDSQEIAIRYSPRNLEYEEELQRLYSRANNSNDYTAMEAIERAMLHDTPDKIMENFSVENGYDVETIRRAKEYVDGRLRPLSAKYGHGLYNVDISADPNDLLDWNKPLSEQPSILEKLRNNPEFWQKTPERSGPQLSPKNMTGSEIYDWLSSGVSADRKGFINEAHASDALRAAGIPGIKYFDETSNSISSGKMVQNYVIFDDSLINIKSME